MTWEHFSREELACPCCGAMEMSAHFMERLEDLRDYLKMTLPLNSAFRCRAHNATVGGGELSAHLTGHGVDIRCHGLKAYLIVTAAPRFGFTGIGLKQHGPHRKRFVHLDDAEAIPGRPRPWIWTY